MRPTDLRYRSPKEKTAEYLLPKITNNGNLLLEIARSKNHPNFPQDRRFNNYESEAKKTGFRVGPGSYEQGYYSVGKSHIKGSHVYKKYHRKSDMSNNAYIFIGNQIMFDATFMIPSKKKARQDICKTADLSEVDPSHNKPSRYRSNFRENRNRSNVMSPNFDEFNSTRDSK